MNWMEKLCGFLFYVVFWLVFVWVFCVPGCEFLLIGFHFLCYHNDDNIVVYL